MICFPNAKINLGLNVLAKRQDGFHQINSVLHPIELYDVLEFKKSDTFSILQQGIPLHLSPQQNIVFKAWTVLNKYYQIPPIEIHLIKKIPVGSGLGGGSSDAAFLLKLLNEFCELDLGNFELEQLSARFGTDCPFFINNKPALVFNKGDNIQPIQFTLDQYYLVLVLPVFQISTKWAYAMIKPSTPQKPVGEIILQPIETWRDELINDFEIPVFKTYPELSDIKNNLYKSGAVYASITGSGSAIYGIFETQPDPDELIRTFGNNLFLSKFGA